MKLNQNHKKILEYLSTKNKATFKEINKACELNDIHKSLTELKEAVFADGRSISDNTAGLVYAKITEKGREAILPIYCNFVRFIKRNWKLGITVILIALSAFIYYMYGIKIESKFDVIDLIKGNSEIKTQLTGDQN